MTRPILVVDDDASIRDVITFALTKAGHATAIAVDGPSALQQIAETQPRLIVLDVGMPGLDGLGVCREVRKTSDVPILFLSARDEEIDRVLGLEIGGDDYVTKPFSPRELVARVGIILRRSEGRTMPPATLERGGLTLDPDRRTTRFGGHGVALTAVEFGLLRTLVQRPGIVFTREQLMESAYDGRVHVSDRTVDSHVRNIRAKLAEVGCRTGIETVHSIGFRLGSCEP